MASEVGTGPGPRRTGSGRHDPMPPQLTDRFNLNSAAGLSRLPGVTTRLALSSGAIEGIRLDTGVTAFLGVPYAAPPVGELRFRPPAPVEPWDGVRPATALGPAPVQGAPAPGRFLADLSSPNQSEDCLNLNVWTPSAEPGARLPVMVWIYGGAFVSGSNAVPAYDGSRLAARGVVVVGINYRLGLLGWLRCPAIGATGGQALADQRAALDWVQHEIAAFGGDPGNVTVFGESAGAASIAAHLAAKATGGFARAVLQSGSYNLMSSVAEADDTAAKVLSHLGVPADQLRDLPLETLMAAQEAATPRSGGVFYRPVADGDLVPEDPGGALAVGVGVPVLCGTNRHEMGFFWGRDERFDDVTDDQLRSLVGRWHEHPDDVVSTYRRARILSKEPVGNRDLAVAIGSDWSFRAASAALARWQSTSAPAHMYRFDWESPLFDGLIGAAHVLEVPFVFGTYDHPTVAAFTGHDRRPEEVAALSNELAGSWVAYATDGHPGWPRYESRRRITRTFGGPRKTMEGPNHVELALWDPRHLHR